MRALFLANTAPMLRRLAPPRLAPLRLTPRLGFGAAFGLAIGLAACATMPAPITGPWSSPSPSATDNGDGIDLQNPPHVVADMPQEQCVPYAREASGIEIFGDANTWWDQAEGRYPRSNIPAVGSVLVMRGYADETRGHVAVVAAIVSSRVIRVDQANWLNQGEVSVAVPVVDVSPNNDWSEVRVWYIPDSHWGGRVYPAQGFIHPAPFGPTS